MCSESDRCTYQIPGPPPTPLGLLALTYTCRLLRSETHDMVHQNATYSLSAQYLPLWLKHLHEHAPQQLKNLRRVTLTGRNKYICSNERWLAEQLQDQVPQLEGVAYQGQVDPIWVFGYAARDGQRPICLRSRIAQAMKSFSPKITVAIEGHAWYKGRDYGYVWESDRQGTFRILRKGKPGNDINGGTGWEPHDVEVEMHNVFFRKSKRNAPWKKWWPH
ncbi:hypothetical protein BDV95DRAFT_8525 [Massariosphaeria phaeospora]|uniref:Uncharacterized protein n=1 Tax=Massariosphaeria phaeospora TaxID=100035 RepID=A0A7C8MDS3_9PLEO|nr:hypothetical protein BDV95DRAFT_8525 [Massariosphaeria phaeospora]